MLSYIEILQTCYEVYVSYLWLNQTLDCIKFESTLLEIREIISIGMYAWYVFN
jgi:hypothetical protein